MSILWRSCYPYSNFSEEKQKRLNKLSTVTQLSPGPALDNPKRPGCEAQFQSQSHRTAAEGAGSRQRADHGRRGEVARGHGAPSHRADRLLSAQEGPPSFRREPTHLLQGTSQEDPAMSPSVFVTPPPQAHVHTKDPN